MPLGAGPGSDALMRGQQNLEALDNVMIAKDYEEATCANDNNIVIFLLWGHCFKG